MKCESCDIGFTLWINLSTCQFEDGTEAKLCDYCSSKLEDWSTKPNFDDTSLIK